MNTPQFWQTVWFFILLFLFAGYTILDGFDLGIGMLSGLVSKKEDRAALFASISPFWDGNEVWLITAGGSLFAAFPFVFSTVLSGLYPFFMIAVVVLMLRAVAFEFWYHDENRRALWAVVFSISSLLIPLALCLALGNVIQGLKINYHGEIYGNPLDLFRPFPAALGLLGVAVTLLHGMAYAAVKTQNGLRAGVLRTGRWLWIVCLALLAATVAFAIAFVPDAARKPVMWIGAGIAGAGMTLSVVWVARDRPARLFATTCGIVAGLWVFIAGLQFPFLIRAAAAAPRFSMTVFNASSGVLTLKIMALTVLCGMALVIAYTIVVYRWFKGPAGEEIDYG